MEGWLKGKEVLGGMPGKRVPGPVTVLQLGPRKVGRSRSPDGEGE